MLSLYPDNALDKLEFNKVLNILKGKCRSENALQLVDYIKFHTKKEFVERALKQTLEFKISLSSPDPIPVDFTQTLKKELQLLKIPNAVLSGLELRTIFNLCICMFDLLNWFKKQNGLFPELELLLHDIPQEKEIPKIIDAVLDDKGYVRDHASKPLIQIRQELDQQRALLRRVFETILRKLAKQGYLADISESFLNNRRTVAINAEHKRIVKGIFHGESDSGKTVFIEPEETIQLNNEIVALERAEFREIQRILAETTSKITPHQSTLALYYRLMGIFDFIRAKALLAIDLKAEMPIITPHPQIKLINAKHPLLIYQQIQTGRAVVPLNLKLERHKHILMISGPNAGGKTVSMKTVGLLQVMLQSGLLIPADSHSEMGIFKQVFIHIGDTQSIENELSTYSAHLKDMKYFTEFANGKTLFFIDELGSGSDPNLGGAFAEAIVECLARKKALGIITTHYLNLKVMAEKNKSIENAAMAFDEELLAPLYQLKIGKPGSSYTFAIAQRIQLPQEIIDRAKELTAREHYKLDNILHKTEKQSVRLGDKEKQLDHLLEKNEHLKEQYEHLIDKERLKQHYATLKLQNKIKKEELDYLKDTERKFKQIIIDWKKADNKQEVIHSAEKLLFRRKQIDQNAAVAKKADKKYEILVKNPEVGDLMRNKTNHQVGRIIEIDGKSAKVLIGKLPFTIKLDEWIIVQAKETFTQSKKSNKALKK